MIYPSLTKIRSFVAVADLANFRQAAEFVGLSPPALSAHVRDLEISLGTPLFHRTTRSVRLTAEGKKFLVRIRRALYEIEAGMLEVRDRSTLPRGQVTLACVPTIATHVLPPLIAAFVRRFPGIAIQVLDNGAPAVYQHVLQGVADLGIGPRPHRSDDLVFRLITYDKFVAVMPSNHQLATRRKVRLKELMRYPLLTLPRDSNVRIQLDSAFDQLGHFFRPAYELQNHYTIGAMVEADLGITIVPSMSISMLRTPLLRVVRLVDPVIAREVGIFFRRDHRPSRSVQTFLQMLSESFKTFTPRLL